MSPCLICLCKSALRSDFYPWAEDKYWVDFGQKDYAKK